MTQIEQIPACDLDELVQFIEVYALKLKKEREQKEKSATAPHAKALSDMENMSLPILSERN